MPAGVAYTGTVTRVLNGDTLHIDFASGDYAGQSRTVRVCGVDCYEERGRYRLIGLGIRQLVYEWLPDDNIVHGVTVGDDYWGRVFASVIRGVGDD